MYYQQFVFILLLVLIIPIVSFSREVNIESSNLPIIVIDTANKTIPDEPKITENMGIINTGKGNRNHRNDSINDYNGLIGIEMQGYSSQSWPKKPYTLETHDEVGENNNVKNKWITTKNDSLPLLYVENFQNGNANNWQPNYPQNWQVIKEEHVYIYELISAGQACEIRKPTSISVLTPFDVGSFELTVKAKCYTNSDNLYRDLCLFFGYRDSVHFYYAHFSAKSDNVHNIIGIVNKADRVKINAEPPGASPARLTGYDWHHLKISRKVETGEIKAYIDDFDIPILNASDSTFKHGRIGIGSFDDTGAFTDVKLWGKVINQNEVFPNRSEVQHEYKLHQNYPNPFNSITQIEFNIPNESLVSMKIYNFLGQEVASLISKQLKMGKHRICWDATELSTGLYFCKFQADHYSDTKPMILLK